MNKIREMVSGNKKRYKDDVYNLDLTYISPRIIAMAMPGEGLIQTVYRNELSEVSKFLNEHHGDKYKVINLSQKAYTYSKFNKKVTEYEWVDHHSPYLPVMFEACEEMHRWLREDDRNIVVVHCMAGKGRTGSLISAYLLFCNAFKNFEAAIRYYKEKRYVGVTHPGQRRYVEYFQEILRAGPNNYQFEPKPRRLISMVFYGVPNFNNGSCKPLVEIYNVRNNEKICSEKFEDMRKMIAARGSNEDICELGFREKNIILYGDTFIKVKHIGTIKNTKMLRIAFHSGYFKELIKDFPKTMLDPDTLVKDPAFPENFKIRIVLEEVDPKHASQEEINLQLNGRDKVIKILKEREDQGLTELETQKLVFGDPDFDDRDEMQVVNIDDTQNHSDAEDGDADD